MYFDKWSFKNQYNDWFHLGFVMTKINTDCDHKMTKMKPCIRGHTADKITIILFLFVF